MFENYSAQKKRGIKLIISAMLAFGGVCIVSELNFAGGAYSVETSYENLRFTNSIFSVILWLCIWKGLYQALTAGFSGRTKKWLVPCVFSVLFAICMIFGSSLESRGSVQFTSIGIWIRIVVLSVISAIAVRYTWDRIVCGKANNAAKAADDKGCDESSAAKTFVSNAALIFLCYVPVFLAVYPGFFVYDAQDELIQVITREFSTHHPLFHVLMLGGIIQLVYKMSGSYNMGIACYILFQMLVFSCVFSWVICRLKAEGMTAGKRIAMALYFGLFPVIAMFALCSAKDGLFACAALVVTVLMRKGVLAERLMADKRVESRDNTLFGISVILMLLLRYNGLYAFLAYAVIVFRKKKLAWAIILIVLAQVLNNGMALVVQADKSENQEMLTVPIQQLARVYNSNKDSFSPQELETLYEILPADALQRYNPKVSDGVKVRFNNDNYSKNPAKYLKLWLVQGIKNPFSYLNAWFMTSYGFWYPDAVIDVYRGNSVFTFTYEDSSYFGFEVEQPGIRQSFFKPLEEIYRRMSLELFQQKMPVLSMLFSPGFLFWIYAFVLGFLVYCGEIGKAAPYLFLMLIWCTVILGPTYLVRYVVYLWFAAPVLLHDFCSC